MSDWWRSKKQLRLLGLAVSVKRRPGDSDAGFRTRVLTAWEQRRADRGELNKENA